MTAPAWYTAGLKDLGQRETGNNAGPFVKSIIAQGKCGSIGDPWCAIWVNAKLEQSGFRGSRSASSQSFRHDINFVKLDGPALGCIVVFWRLTPSSGLGHVGFYDGTDSHGFVSVISGNDSDMVDRSVYNPAGRTFGLKGYYWPKIVPLPVTGKIAIGKAGKGGGKVV